MPIFFRICSNSLGIAQIAELCWQLRGEAGERQVKDCKLALAHNLGLGGAVVVSLLQLGFPGEAGRTPSLSMAAAGNRAFHTSATPMSANESVKEAESMSAGDFKCAPIFNFLASVLQKEGDALVKKINGIYGFKVVGPNGEGTWIVDCKNGSGSIQFGGTATPDVVLSINDVDLFELMTGKLNAQKAFFQGKLKIKGNMGLAMKLREFTSQIATASTSKL